MVVNISPFTAVVAFTADSTSGEHDSQRCTFSRKRDRWTLDADCELSASVTIPAAVTLDGAGHTITLSGDAEGFESAAIRTSGGDVVNLTLDGSGLLPLVPAYFAAITVVAPARLAHVSVRNIQFSEEPSSAIGIEIAAFDGACAMAEDISLENISGSAMLLTGNGRVNVADASVARVTTAVQVNGAVEATLSRVNAQETPVSILAQDHATARLTDSFDSGEVVAEDLARIHQESLTFIGASNRAGKRQRPAAAIAAT